MNQPDPRVAEQLWVRAHEAIKRGNLPQAVRDLAKSFEILKAVNDPRVRQVHAKWVATHKAYLEEKAAGGQPPQASVDYKTLQAQAESAANAGQLAQAIQLYEKVIAGQPGNELAKERVAELQQAQQRAAELGAGAPAAQPAPAAAQPAPAAAQPAPATAQSAPTAAQPAPAAAQPAPAPAQPAPAAAQPFGSAQPAPAAAQPAPAAAQPFGSAQPAPAAAQPAPAAAQPFGSAQPAPAAAQPAPAAAQPFGSAQPAPAAAQPAPAAAQPFGASPAPAAAAGVEGQVAFLESLLGRIEERRRPLA